MTRLREIFGRHGVNKPLDSDGFVIGLFQIVFGLWLILPGTSFLFITLGQNDPSLSPIFAHWSEPLLGAIIIAMGLTDMVCIWFKKYRILKNMDIVGTAYWAFVTVSWILVAPHSTAVPVYGFFTLFSMYEFYVWSIYCRDAGLLNKRKEGNI